MMNLAKVTSTVGLNIGKIDAGGIRLNFWDLGGQEELQGCTCVLLHFLITDRADKVLEFVDVILRVPLLLRSVDSHSLSEAE